MHEQCCYSAWTVIIVSCTVNPSDFIVHALKEKEKKKRKEMWNRKLRCTIISIQTDTNIWIVNQSKPTFLENPFLNLTIPYIYRYLASQYLLIFLGVIGIEGHRFTLCGTQLVLWSTQPSCQHSVKATEKEEEEDC